MKQFFKFMFASMLGFFLVFLVLIFLFFGMIASLASLGKKDVVAVKPQTVYHLTLQEEIVDRSTSAPMESFDFMTFTVGSTIGLNELLRNLEKASLDENISGIFLELSFMQTGWATLSEIREAILKFKESGKFVVAYGDMMSQSAYYLASVADKVYINPEGMLDFRGLNAEIMFYKNMLEKIGVDAQVIRHGKFKSAGEPFFLDKLSNENRVQIQSYLSSLWNTALKGIAETRSIPVNRLNEIADRYESRIPQMAMEAGLIDGILYRDEMQDEIRSLLGLEKDKKVEMVNYARYNRAPLPASMVSPRSRDKIAVIYGSGNIVTGKGGDQSMGADVIAEAISKARRDSTVKAIVFRVNSPGGSALASDIMLREAKLAAEAKPFIVSMGDVAASGGYYVACYADKIIANPNTITGSIGVFGMIPNMGKMFNDKLGISFDNVKTNELADFPSVSRALRPAERVIIQESIERVYDTFIQHVASGRNMPISSVDSIAQGRVWSGVDARNIGLVDDFGGLNYAIEQAAEMANLEKYRVVEYPVKKEFLEKIMESFGNLETRLLKARLGESYYVFRQMQQATENSGIQMRMPFDVVID